MNKRKINRYNFIPASRDFGLLRKKKELEERSIDWIGIEQNVMGRTWAVESRESKELCGSCLGG